MESGKKTIQAVILTKSGKHKGACVTAYDIDSRKIIRFVSDAKTAGEISFDEIRDIFPMDLVEAKIIEDCPIGPQTENCLVENFSIKRIQKYFGTIEEIRNNVKNPDSRSFMEYPAYRLDSVSEFDHSLEIISVNDLILEKSLKYDAAVTTRASFMYNDKKYTDYRVTDFTYDMRKTDQDKINIPYADLVVSIPYTDFIVDGVSKGYYKFIAAIYPIEKKKPVDVVDEPDEYWTNQEDIELVNKYMSGYSIQWLAEKHHRSPGAIRTRLKKLGVTK